MNCCNTISFSSCLLVILLWFGVGTFMSPRRICSTIYNWHSNVVDKGYLIQLHKIADAGKMNQLYVLQVDKNAVDTKLPNRRPHQKAPRRKNGLG